MIFKKDLVVFVLSIIFSLLVLFLDFKGVLLNQKKYFMGIIRPFNNSLYLWKGAGIEQYIPFLKDKQKQIDFLSKENSFLVSQISELKDVEKENLEIRKLLGTNLPPSWKISVGEVVKRDGDFLTIVTDSQSKIDQIVLLSNIEASQGPERLIGVYVGKVEKLGDYISVALPTSPSSKLEVVIRSADTFDQVAMGILEGKGGRILLDQVLSSENLKPGDWILTRIKGDPRSELLVGRITQEITSRDLTFKKAEARLVFDQDKLDKVFLIIK